MAYSGWALPEDTKRHLLTLFPAAYPVVIAHHVTLRYPVDAMSTPPPRVNSRIVGIADDNLGVQALIVEIDGTVLRHDGRAYHITWSLADGRKPVESNKVIDEYGYEPITPIDVYLVPRVFL